MPDLGAALGPGSTDLLTEIEQIPVGSDRTGRPPRRAFAGLRSLGFGRMRLPLADGGLGASVPALLETVRRLATADSGLAQSWRTHILATERHLTSPASPQRDRWLHRIAAGAMIGGGWSEADGSGAARFTARLARDGDRLTLTGRKFYSTGSAYADRLESSAVDDDGHECIVAVPATAAGLTVVDWDGFCQRATASGTTVVAGVVVDPDDVIPFSHVRARSGVDFARYRDDEPLVKQQTNHTQGTRPDAPPLLAGDVQRRFARVTAFAELLVPELRVRGLFGDGPADSTLRSRLRQDGADRLPDSHPATRFGRDASAHGSTSQLPVRE